VEDLLAAGAKFSQKKQSGVGSGGVRLVAGVSSLAGGVQQIFFLFHIVQPTWVLALAAYDGDERTAATL